MKCRDIFEKLENDYPLSLAESWDNVGLLLGDEEAEVKTVVVALDVTEASVAKAVEEGADLLITHHPLIFKPMSRITRQERNGRRLLTLAENKVAYYAMHTNFDIAGMADLNAAELQLEDVRVLAETTADDNGEPAGFGRIGRLPEVMTAGELAERVKEVYRLKAVRLYGDPAKEVATAAICSGSGRSFIGAARENRADIYITGDVDYHSAIDAVADGLMLIDAGHYGTEFGFISFMTKKLADTFPELRVIACEIRQPYEVI
ncbi:MAG: Nif3-like dinuclear metal center hexameric protein [Lachnospiraceae bacterium]|nr:Nif3-like dinuclear metal center hexameric protein [Lachnospiraceae bacterium]